MIHIIFNINLISFIILRYNKITYTTCTWYSMTRVFDKNANVYNCKFMRVFVYKYSYIYIRLYMM